MRSRDSIFGEFCFFKERANRSKLRNRSVDLGRKFPLMLCKKGVYFQVKLQQRLGLLQSVQNLCSDLLEEGRQTEVKNQRTQNCLIKGMPCLAFFCPSFQAMWQASSKNFFFLLGRVTPESLLFCCFAQKSYIGVQHLDSVILLKRNKSLAFFCNV